MPDAEIPDELNVFLVAMIMFVGAVAGGVVLDLAGRMRKNVPDRTAAAVLVDGALDLIGRGRGAPHESLWKAGSGVRVGRRLLFWARRIRRGRRHGERGEARQFAKLPAREFSGHLLLPSASMLPVFRVRPMTSISMYQFDRPKSGRSRIPPHWATG